MDEHNSTVTPESQALQGEAVQLPAAVTLQETAAQEEKAGMPQMDHTTFPSQLFWLTVTFVALYVVLARIVMPRIHDVLETRQERIAHDLDRASKLQQEAEEAKSVYQKALANARNDAQQLLEDTAQSIRETATSKSAELDTVLKSKLDESGNDIARAADEAHSKLHPVSVELAAAIVEKLTKNHPSTEEVEAAISELSKERLAA